MVLSISIGWCRQSMIVDTLLHQIQRLMSQCSMLVTACVQAWKDSQELLFLIWTLCSLAKSSIEQSITLPDAMHNARSRDVVEDVFESGPKGLNLNCCGCWEPLPNSCFCDAMQLCGACVCKTEKVQLEEQSSKVLWFTKEQMCKIIEWSLQELPEWSDGAPHKASEIVAELEPCCDRLRGGWIDQQGNPMYSEAQVNELTGYACDAFIEICGEAAEEAGFKDVSNETYRFRCLSHFSMC